MSIEIADLVAILRADSAQFDTAMVKAREEMRGVAGSAHGATGAISSLALGLGALTIGGLAYAVKKAIDFQTTITQVTNNTTMGAAAVATMRAGILQLAATSNAPIDQLATGFMHITNYGFSATDSLTILKQAMMSATSTGGDTGKVAELLANVLHEFNMPATAAAQAMDVLHLAAAQGNMTLEQFVSVAGKSLAMAANLHVPLTDVSAAMSALTRHGIPAAEASTLISGALSKILNPAVATTKVLKQISDQTGINLVGDFTQAGLASKGLSGVLSDLARASQETGTNIFKLIPATRGGLAAMILTGNGTTDYKNILVSLNDAMAGRLHPTLDAYRRLQQTTSYQMGELGNQVQVLAIDIGSVLLPPLTQLVGWITSIVGQFISWVQHSGLVKGAMAAIQTALQTAQPYVSTFKSAITTIVTDLGNWAKSIIDWTGKHKELVDALGQFGEKLLALVAAKGALTLISDALGGIAAYFVGSNALALLVAALWTAWQQNWGDIQGKTQAVWGVIGPILSGLSGDLDKLTGIQASAFIGIAALAASLWTMSQALAIIEGAQSAITVIKELLGLGGSSGGTTKGGGTKKGAGVDPATKAANDLKDAITKYFPPLTSALQKYLEPLTKELSNWKPLPTSVTLSGVSTLTGKMSDLTQHLQSLTGSVASLIKKLGDLPKSAGTTKGGGTVTVPDLTALTQTITQHVPPLTSAITTYFEPLTRAIQGWKPGTGPAAGPGTKGTTVGATVTGLEPLTQTITQHVPPLTSAITTYFEPLTRAIQGWKPGTGPAAGPGTKGTTVGATVTGLEPLTQTITQHVPPLTSAITVQLPPLTSAITTWFPKLIAALQAAGAGGKGGGGGTIASTRDQLGPFVVRASISATDLKDIANKIKGWFSPAGDFGAAVVTGTANLAKTLGTGLMDFTLTPGFGAGLAGNFLTWATQHAKDLNRGAAQLGKQVTAEMFNFANSTVDATGALYGALQYLADSGWSKVKAAATQLGTTIAGELFSNLNLKTALQNGLQNTGTWLTDAGNSIMTGLLNGMKQTLGGDIQNWLGSLGDWFKQHKGPPSADATMLHGNGQLILQGLMTGMKSQMPALQAQVQGISAALSGVSSSSGMRGAISAAGTPTPVHNHIYIDGKEIATQIFNQAAKHRRMRPELVS